MEWQVVFDASSEHVDGVIVELLYGEDFAVDDVDLIAKVLLRTWAWAVIRQGDEVASLDVSALFYCC